MAQLDQFFLSVGQLLVLAVDAAQVVDQGLLLTAILPVLQQVGDLTCRGRRGPTQVGFEDLTDVHPRGHAQRVQHDVDVLAVFQVRHVLDRQDLGDDALVAVTAGHLVAGLQLALHGHEDLDHLHHARRQFVAALQLVDLVLETTVQALAGLVELTAHGLQLAHRLLVVEGDLPPQAGRDLVQLLGGDLRHGPGPWDPRRRPCRVISVRRQARGHVAVQDGELVVAVLAQTVDLGPFDGQGALVLVDAVTVEHADFHDGAGDARGQAQGGVADVGGLLAEDGAQELFFRRHRAFALGRHLAHQDVARQDLGADRHDAGFVEVAQGFLADVRECRG